MMLEPLSQRPRQQLLAVYLVQGKQALAKNRVKPALNYAKTALGLAPGHAAALELRADVALKKRQFAIAVKDYELALEGTGANKALKRRVQQKLKAARKKVR
jgi:tetratricopeptide (TPR) repeat protein